MRILVFFDLPMDTAQERREYNTFRKRLIKNGFIMLQKSVYTRLLSTPSVENSVMNLIQTCKPSSGIVQTLTVTEKQFSKIKYIVGENTSEYIDSNERLLIL